MCVYVCMGCVCMCVYMYTCTYMYVCGCVCMYTCVYVCIHVYACVCVCVLGGMGVCIRVGCVCMCIYMYTCVVGVYTCACICVCMYVYMCMCVVCVCVCWVGCIYTCEHVHVCVEGGLGGFRTPGHYFGLLCFILLREQRMGHKVTAVLGSDRKSHSAQAAGAPRGRGGPLSAPGRRRAKVVAAELWKLSRQPTSQTVSP